MMRQWLEVDEGEGEDRVVIHAARAPRDLFWVLTFYAFGAIGFFVVGGFVLGILGVVLGLDIDPKLLIVGGLGIAIVSVALARWAHFGVTRIYVREDEIVVERRRSLSAKWRSRREELVAVTFENYARFEGEGESLATLNLWSRRRYGSWRRLQLGWLMAEECRREVFEELIRLLQKRGYDSTEFRDSAATRPKA